MKFEDKLTPTGEPERYKSGEPTERFVMVLETVQETASVHAALANVASIAMQSEMVLEKDDTKLLLDMLRANEYQRSHLVLGAEQAKRIVTLLRQGAGSVTLSVIRNQFASQFFEHLDITEDELTQLALEAADALADEIEARRFRKELVDATFQDFLDSPGES